MRTRTTEVNLSTPLLDPHERATPTPQNQQPVFASYNPHINPRAQVPLLSAQASFTRNRAGYAACDAIERLSQRGRMMWVARSAQELQEIPGRLAQAARDAGRPFVCLDHPDRLDDLLVALTPGPAGWQAGEGPLQALLKKGGWLYIHYEHFTAAEAESLNDLFAQIPMFRNVAVSSQLVLIGGILRATLASETQSEAFVSRFDAWIFNDSLPNHYREPLHAVECIDPEQLQSRGGAVIDLFGATDYRERLCARPCVEGDKAKLLPGRLRQALQTQDTVVLRNAPWDDVAFCMFMRELLQGSARDLEGPLLLRPHHQLVRCDGYTVAEQARARGFIVKTPEDAADAHVITSRNFSFLHHAISIDGGRVREIAGVLDGLPLKTPLRVAGKLLTHQWMELSFGTLKRAVWVDPAVPVPAWLRRHLDTQGAAAPALMACRPADVAGLPQGSSCVVHCDDTELATRALCTAFEVDGTARIYDVGPNTETGDLLFSLRRQAGRFGFRLQEMAQALQSGQTVIVRHLSTHPNLCTDLLPLLVSCRPMLWCEASMQPLRGRLIVLENLSRTVPAQHRYRLELADEALTTALRGEFAWVDAAWVAATEAFIDGALVLARQRNLVTGPAGSQLALLRKVATLRQAAAGKPADPRQARAQAISVALLGALFFDGEAMATARRRLQDTLGVDLAAVATLQQPTSLAEWNTKLDVCAAVLQAWPAIFLQGPPGSGKTFCTHAMGRRLNAVVHGPLSVGDDTSVDEIVGALRTEKGTTQWHPGCIDTWARAPGPEIQLLVVDEANLVPEHFWNFLAGLFAPEPSLLIDGKTVRLGSHHRVIFTGNQDTLVGRVVSQVIKSHFVTVPFANFTESFLLDEILLPRLRQLLDTANEAQLQMARRACAGVLADLRSAGATDLISPRNIEEAVVRVRVRRHAGDVHSLAACMAQAMLDVQVGGLPAALGETLRATAALNWGVAPVDTAALVQIAAVSHRRLVLTESSAALASAIAEFLVVRHARRNQRSLLGLGQSGMLIEGPSGRGKDEWVMSVCEAAGLTQLHPNRPAAADGYMALNAGLGFAHLKEMIASAQANGHLVLISELNLLGSALVEGQLNQLLQGHGAPGFAVIATVNPGYQGRCSISEAQRNRCICISLPPYREAELLQIVTARLPTRNAAEAPRLVAYHQAIISMLDVAKSDIRPTPRELIRVCDAMPEPDVDGLLQRVYAPYLLIANAVKVDVALRPKQDTQALRALAQWLTRPSGGDRVTCVYPDDAADDLGTLCLNAHLVKVATHATLRQQTMQVLVQAAAAAAHPGDANAAVSATGPAWEAVSSALGYRLVMRLAPDPETAAMLLDSLRLPTGPEAWERATEATSRRDHLGYALACELLYPGTHAAANLQGLRAAQREACAEAMAFAAPLQAALERVQPFNQGMQQADMARLQIALAPVLARYQALIPLSVWEKIGKVIPTEAMTLVWDAGMSVCYAAATVGARACVAGARATKDFVVDHKVIIALATAPVWIAPALALVVSGGALAISVAPLAGALLGLEWCTEKTLDAWRRHLPSPTKAFRYHADLDKLSQVEPPKWPNTIQASRLDGQPCYVAEGYLAEFSRLGNLRSCKYVEAPALAIAPGATAVGTMKVKLRSGDLVKKSHSGGYWVSLPISENYGPAHVVLTLHGENRAGTADKPVDNTTGLPLPGEIEVRRAEDGRFVAFLSHKKLSVSRLDARDRFIELSYDLMPQLPCPRPETYGRQPLPFKIDYAAWPQFAEFCDVLSSAAPEHSVTALCTWLQENALYDRGNLVALNYGWSEVDLSSQRNPVNTFMRLRRGSALQSAQAFMAVVRDKIQVPVRVATGTYHANPRTPRTEVQSMHAWAEVYLEGRGWVSFDPTARRFADDWVERRKAFWKAMAEKLGIFVLPPHINAIERLGDTFEQPTHHHETPATTRLRVAYKVAGDDAIATAFADVLLRDFSEQLFASSLKAQQRLACAPPGHLDVARVARGETKIFVNSDVGRAPLSKKILVAANDIFVEPLPKDTHTSAARLSTIYWQAFFQLGCPIEVLCADGRIVSVTSTDELLVLADTFAATRGWQREQVLRRHDAMSAQVKARARSSRSYARLDSVALHQTFFEVWQARATQVKPSPKVETQIWSVNRADTAGWSAVTHVTFNSKFLSGRNIYQALRQMPNVESVSVQDHAPFTRVRIPYLPQLREVVFGIPPRLKPNLDFLPGATPWPVTVRKQFSAPPGRPMAVSRLGCDLPTAPPLRHKSDLMALDMASNVSAADWLPAVQEIFVESEPVTLGVEPDIACSGSAEEAAAGSRG